MLNKHFVHIQITDNNKGNKNEKIDLKISILLIL